MFGPAGLPHQQLVVDLVQQPDGAVLGDIERPRPVGDAVRALGGFGEADLGRVGVGRDRVWRAEVAEPVGAQWHLGRGDGGGPGWPRRGAQRQCQAGDKGEAGAKHRGDR